MEGIGMKTVGEIAVEFPASTRLFEKAGIDYCCGGHRRLDEACRTAGVSYEEVTSSLVSLVAGKGRETEADEWTALSLTDVCSRIVERFHVATTEELSRLAALTDKVCGVHGQNHPELMKVREIFTRLADDMRPHMMKEEQVLFPFVEQMDAAVAMGETPLPPFFGTVRNPVRMMMVEHDAVGEMLRELREVTSNYALPEDACISYRTLYAAFQEFERMTHSHIHVENNILFPRCIEMEEQHLGQPQW